MVYQDAETQASRRGTHKWKIGGIPRRRLDQKLVPPAFKRLEALGIIDIVDQHTAVGAAVKSHSQRLESFLAGGIPELNTQHVPPSVDPSHLDMACNGSKGLRETHLHGDLSVIDHDLPRQEISADGGLVARTKLLLDLHASASASLSGPGATVQGK